MVTKTKRKTKKFQAYLKAIPGSGGVLQVIATRLKVGRSAVCKYVSENPEIRDAINDEGERMLDVAENRLFKRVEDNDWKAIERVLKSGKAAKRGWSETTTQNVNENRDKKLELVMIKSPEDLKKLKEIENAGSNNADNPSA